VAWLPLLILSMLEKRAWGDAVAVPFLLDIEVHVRFLLTLPLLIVAELVVHQRMRPLVREFLERGLLPDASRARFDAAVAAAQRLRNSAVAEGLLIALVYVVGLLVWPHYGELNVATWYAVPARGGRELSPAGWWFVYVSLPLFQFILLRWYFRLFVWIRFLAHLATARRVGLREYGTLAQRYVRAFDDKWLRGGASAGEPLVGSADIQSLADLGNSFELVRSMRVVPITRDALLQLAVITLLPVAPLLLTMISLEELLKRLLQVVF